jgi:hypothetical protein
MDFVRFFWVHFWMIFNGFLMCPNFWWSIDFLVFLGRMKIDDIRPFSVVYFWENS